MRDVALMLKGLFVGRFLGALGNQLLLVAVPLLVFKLTGSISLAGVAFAVEWLPRLVALPLAGSLVDRFGGRPVYLAADFARAFACGLAFAAVIAFPDQAYLTLVVLGAVVGVCYEQGFVALEATVPRLVPDEQLHEAQSILGILDQTALLLGPAVAGLLVGFVEVQWLLLVVAGIFLLGAVNMLVVRVRAPRAAASGAWGSVLAELTTGARTFLGIRSLRNLVLLTMLVNLMVGVVLVEGPGLVTGVFAQPEGFYGLINTAAGLAAVGIVALIPWLKRRVPLSAVALAAFVVIALCCVALGVVPSFGPFVVAYVGFFGLVALFTVHIRAERARVIPAEALGRTIGVIVLLNFALLPAAGLLVATLSEVVGPQGLIMGVGWGCLVAGLPLFRHFLQAGPAAT
jgi:MFS family permease